MVVRAEQSTPVDADDGDQVGAVVIELGLWSVEVFILDVAGARRFNLATWGRLKCQLWLTRWSWSPSWTSW